MKVYLSKKADIRLIEYLKDGGHELVLVDGSFSVGNKSISSKVSEPILCHPDVYYCNLGSELYQGDVRLLGKEYPNDVLYNAARVGEYFICSKYTSENLLDKAKQRGLRLLFVPQGYVKCNLVVLDNEHVITEDEGIFNAIINSVLDIKVLLISKGHAALPGYNYGFIGGASGLVENEIIFNGDLSAHPDFDKIKSFIQQTGIKLRYFNEYPLTDIGSIIALQTT